MQNSYMTYIKSLKPKNPVRLIGSSIGERILNGRKNLNFTQEQLGKFLGKSGVTIGKWEKGQVEKISAGDLSKLSYIFGCSAEILLHGSEDSKKSTRI